MCFNGQFLFCFSTLRMSAKFRKKAQMWKDRRESQILTSQIHSVNTKLKYVGFLLIVSKDFLSLLSSPRK